MKQLLVILILTASINSLSAQTEKIIDEKAGISITDIFQKN